MEENKAQQVWESSRFAGPATVASNPNLLHFKSPTQESLCTTMVSSPRGSTRSRSRSSSPAVSEASASDDEEDISFAVETFCSRGRTPSPCPSEGMRRTRKTYHMSMVFAKGCTLDHLEAVFASGLEAMEVGRDCREPKCKGQFGERSVFLGFSMLRVTARRLARRVGAKPAAAASNVPAPAPDDWEEVPDKASGQLCSTAWVLSALENLEALGRPFTGKALRGHSFLLLTAAADIAGEVDDGQSLADRICE
eukprot:g15412.t1